MSPQTRQSSPTMKSIVQLCAFAGVILAGCAEGPPPYSNPPAFALAGIEGGSDGKCYGNDVTPARTQTVTRQEQIGFSVEGPVYETVTRQLILTERTEVSFEIVCPDDLSPEFISALQRALAARGYYGGPINGVVDAATTNGLQAYQAQHGLNTALLDLRTAKSLGLVALTPEELGIIQGQY